MVLMDVMVEWGLEGPAHWSSCGANSSFAPIVLTSHENRGGTEAPVGLREFWVGYQLFWLSAANPHLSGFLFFCILGARLTLDLQQLEKKLANNTFIWLCTLGGKLWDLNGCLLSCWWTQISNFSILQWNLCPKNQQLGPFDMTSCSSKVHTWMH